MNEHEFDKERAAMFATGIGLARLHLKDGKPDEALADLNRACDQVDELTYAYGRECGYSDEAIERFVGAPAAANSQASPDA